ncbi:LacI family DNA-binding transcriptional regulator [Blautia obeum]|uniref:HTH-type transcriptional regulator DegA n=1 Tax=Blautia obeum TaxID=40520 RepID=A0A564SAH3_9FIRM|nr:LacI family DNA-binding transcriptional regulator [Blautia obeum]VUW91570.1 HTH-type transcriptional regulator DegA [Blautia obeum]
MSDDRTITIDDVAKLAGVSRATAGRVVGNYGSVSEKSRERVWDAVRQLDYQPNLIARGLRSQTTKTIAVIVGSIRNTYSTALVYAVEKEAQKKGYNVLICTTHEDIEKELKHLKDLNSRKVDGVILMSAYRADANMDKKYKEFYISKLPIVFVDRSIPGINRDVIQSENFDASYKATKYLMDMGHRKIGIIATSNFSTVQERIKGYKAAFANAGIEYDESLIASVDELSDKMSRKVCHEFLEEHPDITALYILNNSLCSGVLLDLKERQMKIPQDISLLVWDDEEYNELLDITTIEQPITEIGKQATRRLFELIGEPEETTDFECKKLDPELIIRKSCTLPKYRK